MVSDGAAAPTSPEEPICVVTKITFGSWWSLLGAIRRFRRLRRIGRRTIPGLLEVHLRIRRNATLMFISLWQDELALLQFTTLESHALEIYGAVAVVFFLISFPLTRLAAHLEKRLI